MTIIYSGILGEISEERALQQTREGWTVEHDDEHSDESLAMAAACYALPENVRGARKAPRRVQQDVAGRGECPIIQTVTVPYVVPTPWPPSWHPSWWKPKDRRRDLIRAAALIVAEIERLDRAAIRESSPSGGDSKCGS